MYVLEGEKGRRFETFLFFDFSNFAVERNVNKKYFALAWGILSNLSYERPLIIFVFVHIH